jgi:hypothetical protein
VACRLPTAAVVRLIQAAPVRLWFPALPVSAPGRVGSAKQKAPADRRPVACRLSAAAAVRPIQAAAVRLWFPALPASAPGQEPPAREKVAAGRRPVACRLPAAVVVHLVQAAVVRLWFQAQPVSAPAREQPAKVQAAADRRAAVWRESVACQRAASNRELECLTGSYSGPAPPLARLTAAAKARARQPRPPRQCRQQQRRPPAMILRRRAETALLEAAVRQLDPAVGTQAIEQAARSSASARPDWSP